MVGQNNSSGHQNSYIALLGEGYQYQGQEVLSFTCFQNQILGTWASYLKNNRPESGSPWLIAEVLLVALCVAPFYFLSTTY